MRETREFPSTGTSQLFQGRGTPSRKLWYFHRVTFFQPDHAHITCTNFHVAYALLSRVTGSISALVDGSDSQDSISIPRTTSGCFLMRRGKVSSELRGRNVLGDRVSTKTAQLAALMATALKHPLFNDCAGTNNPHRISVNAGNSNAAQLATHISEARRLVTLQGIVLPANGAVPSYKWLFPRQGGLRKKLAIYC